MQIRQLGHILNCTGRRIRQGHGQGDAALVFDDFHSFAKTAVHVFKFANASRATRIAAGSGWSLEAPRCRLGVQDCEPDLH